jgi:hypothetical protein
VPVWEVLEKRSVAPPGIRTSDCPARAFASSGQIMKRFITKYFAASGVYDFNVGNPVDGSVKLLLNIEAYLPIDETLCPGRFDCFEYLRSSLCRRLHKTTFLKPILNQMKPRGFLKTHLNIFFLALSRYFSWSGFSDQHFICVS